MHRAVAGVVVAVAALSCSGSATMTPPSAIDADAIERDVWATVIADLHSHSGAEPELLSANALQELRQIDSSGDSLYVRVLTDSLPGLDRELIASFHRRNADSGSIETPLRLGFPYIWVTPGQLIAQRGRDRVDQQHVLDDRLYVGLSHVGFTNDYRWAILYRTYNCGPLCGAGEFLLMERTGDALWRLRRAYTAWVS